MTQQHNTTTLKPKFFLCFLTMLFFVFSCQNDIESSTSQVAPNKAMLGKKLNNPYSLKVMKQAYKNIKEKYLNNASDVSRTAALFNDFNVETNFLYEKQTTARNLAYYRRNYDDTRQV